MPKFNSPRLKFPSGEQRKFVEEVLCVSGLKIEKLAPLVNVSPRTIRDWRREKFNITEKALDTFCKKFIIPQPANKSSLIEDWKQMKLGISRMGGFAYYDRYGLPGTIESRRRGGIAGMAKLRKLGKIPPVKIFNRPKLSEKLAEFFGIMLGDGSMSKLQINITLNSVADANYINVVINLCNKLFGVRPKDRKRKRQNARVIYYDGINLVKYLIKFGLIPGNKVKNQVGVPKWILNNSKYKTACLRGLMDTDGGVFTHRYKVNDKPYAYRKICFTNRSLPLLHFVYQTLMELGFNPKLVDKVENKKVWLYNTHEVDRYLSLVKSSNERLSKHTL